MLTLFLAVALTASSFADRRWTPPLMVANQGMSSTCSAQAWCTALRCAPYNKKAPDPFKLYAISSLVHYGEYQTDGISAYGVGQDLIVLGFIKGFSMTSKVDRIAAFIEKRGPVVMATEWYPSMEPDKNGLVHIVGAPGTWHAYVLIGHKGRMFEGVNSYGAEWGKHGRFFITEADLALLLVPWESCAYLPQVE